MRVGLNATPDPPERIPRARSSVEPVLDATDPAGTEHQGHASRLDSSSPPLHRSQAPEPESPAESCPAKSPPAAPPAPLSDPRTPMDHAQEQSVTEPGLFLLDHGQDSDRASESGSVVHRDFSPNEPLEADNMNHDTDGDDDPMLCCDPLPSDPYWCDLEWFSENDAWDDDGAREPNVHDYTVTAPAETDESSSASNGPDDPFKILSIKEALDPTVPDVQNTQTGTFASCDLHPAESGEIGSLDGNVHLQNQEDLQSPIYVDDSDKSDGSVTANQCEVSTKSLFLEPENAEFPGYGTLCGVPAKIVWPEHSRLIVRFWGGGLHGIQSGDIDYSGEAPYLGTSWPQVALNPDQGKGLPSDYPKPPSTSSVKRSDAVNTSSGEHEWSEEVTIPVPAISVPQGEKEPFVTALAQVTMGRWSMDTTIMLLARHDTLNSPHEFAVSMDSGKPTVASSLENTDLWKLAAGREMQDKVVDASGATWYTVAAYNWVGKPAATTSRVVSGDHACITIVGQNLARVKDLGSRHGTELYLDSLDEPSSAIDAQQKDTPWFNPSKAKLILARHRKARQGGAVHHRVETTMHFDIGPPTAKREMLSIPPPTIERVAADPAADPKVSSGSVFEHGHKPEEASPAQAESLPQAMTTPLTSCSDMNTRAETPLAIGRARVSLRLPDCRTPRTLLQPTYSPASIFRSDRELESNGRKMVRRMARLAQARALGQALVRPRQTWGSGTSKAGARRARHYASRAKTQTELRRDAHNGPLDEPQDKPNNEPQPEEQCDASEPPGEATMALRESQKGGSDSLPGDDERLELTHVHEDSSLPQILDISATHPPDHDQRMRIDAEPPTSVDTANLSEHQSNGASLISTSGAEEYAGSFASSGKPKPGNEHQHGPNEGQYEDKREDRDGGEDKDRDRDEDMTLVNFSPSRPGSTSESVLGKRRRSSLSESEGKGDQGIPSESPRQKKQLTSNKSQRLRDLLLGSMVGAAVTFSSLAVLGSSLE